MKLKITDLMDLYEDPGAPSVSGSGENPKDMGKETTILKVNKHSFNWKQAAIAAVLVLSVGLGGFALWRSFRGVKPDPAGTQTSSDPSGGPSESTAPKPTGGDRFPLEDNAEVNRILSVFAAEGILDSDTDLAGEYETAHFVYMYMKLYHAEEFEQRETDEGLYDTLTLDQVNGQLKRLIGKTLSPQDGTDYSVQRGDGSEKQHETFRGGRFWWPKEKDGEEYNRFAQMAGWTPDGDGVRIAFTIFAVDLARWPDYSAWELPLLTEERVDEVSKAATIVEIGHGTAFFRPADEGTYYCESFRAEYSCSFENDLILYDVTAALEKIVKTDADRYSVDGGKELSVPSLREASSLTIGYFTPEDAKILPSLENLKELQLLLDGSAFQDGAGLEFLERLPGLESLTLDFDRDAAVPISLEVLNRCTGLKTLFISSGPQSLDLSKVSGLQLERLCAVGFSASDVASIGTADYVYLIMQNGALDQLAPLAPKTLNLNCSWVDPPMIDYTGAERLTTVETLMGDVCTISDFSPILAMEQLKTLQLGVSCTEANASVFFSQSEQTLVLTGSDTAVLDQLELEVPAEQLREFLQKEGTTLVLWLRYQ